MAVASPAAVGSSLAPAPRAAASVLAGALARAPLVPAALALTIGIILDRQFAIPLPACLIVAMASLACWGACRVGRTTRLAQVYLILALVAVGAARHHWQRDVVWPDDISHYGKEDEERPVQLRGVLAEEPIIAWRPPPNALRPVQLTDTTRSVLRVTSLRQCGEWIAASGRARLIVMGHLQGLHIGDEVQVVGRLALPHAPANPGEFDYASHLRDQGIRAVVTVEKTPEGVTRHMEGWTHSLFGWLVVIRGWGQRVLQEALPSSISGLAGALLLGEGSTMTGAEYEKYTRTGVIHVLAISGQHLTVLAWFLWSAFRLLGMPRRWGAALVALFLFAYALLTGGEPPVMRAAVTVAVICGGILFRRPANGVNTFALAWLVVAALNPTDIFRPGCQLSFLGVALLYWCASHFFRIEPDPLERLADESRPTWVRAIRAGGWLALQLYAINAIIWLAVAPLVAAHYHLVAPPALVIGPPLVLLTSLALIAGFLLLLAALVWWPLVLPFAFVTGCSLSGCERIVDIADGLPSTYWYVGDIPEWWLWIFYLGVFAVLLIEPLRQRWRWIGLAALTWFGVGLLSGSVRPPEAELRCTFLAVGHGGCTVLETPDGRTILYDTGAMSGPDVARRQIAPYLWHRGVRRIDEVILSHADLDHFNGLVALLDRFTIAQVTCTPTFREKASPAVRLTLETLRRRRVAVRIVQAGDRLTAGPVEMEVLHPPGVGPNGNENVRSLVLLVRHEGHAILLTGDLEGPGLSRVLEMPPVHVDVLMAPHHGSRKANPAQLAEWARPEVVVSCQGPPHWPTRTPETYEKQGAVFLGTWPHGAVTVHSRRDGLVVTTYRSRQRIVLR